MNKIVGNICEKLVSLPYWLALARLLLPVSVQRLNYPSAYS